MLHNLSSIKSSTKAAPGTDLTFTSVSLAFSNFFSAYLISSNPQPVALKSLVPWDFDMYHHPLHPNSPKVLTTTLELTCIFCFKFLRENLTGAIHTLEPWYTNQRSGTTSAIPFLVGYPFLIQAAWGWQQMGRVCRSYWLEGRGALVKSPLGTLVPSHHFNLRLSDN